MENYITKDYRLINQYTPHLEELFPRNHEYELANMRRLARPKTFYLTQLYLRSHVRDNFTLLFDLQDGLKGKFITFMPHIFFEKGQRLYNNFDETFKKVSNITIKYFQNKAFEKLGIKSTFQFKKTINLDKAEDIQLIDNIKVDQYASFEVEYFLTQEQIVGSFKSVLMVDMTS